MGSTEQAPVRTALQVVSYLQPWEDTTSPWNGWGGLNGWMKLLKLELGQDSGVDTSSTKKKPTNNPRDFRCSQAFCFSHVIWKTWEKTKKRTPSVEMHTRKHLGLVQLWAGKRPAGHLAGFPVSFFSHAPLTLSLALYHIFMILHFNLILWFLIWGCSTQL